MSTPTLETTLWSKTYEQLKQLFPSDIFEMWFSELRCTREDESTLVLETKSEFNAIWIESNFLDTIAQQARSFSGMPVSVSVVASPAPAAELVAAAAATDSRGVSGRQGLGTALVGSRSTVAGEAGGRGSFEHPSVRRSLLNPSNTFDNFVVGSGTQLAHAASIAVANAPGRAYNPLFVYGETGLGKTHLMHAVAHQMILNNPSARIAYVSTEKFTNEFIHAIRENKVANFRKFYRNVDALLVDDIHFLSGKESTQEEFFHTFNDLFESGRQIFLASDRPANEIERLESRLVSRFQWGLVTDVQAPDFETRVAILRQKACAMKIELEDEIMNFLAERVSRNVRRMEGALTRIAGYGSLTKQRIDIGSVERLIGDLLQEESASQVNIEDIQKKVSDYYKIRVSDLVGRRRLAGIVFPRQVAMFISRTLTSEPLKNIGEAFGGRDHGTVIHAIKQVENAMEQDGSVKRVVDYLIKQLSSGRN